MTFESDRKTNCIKRQLNLVQNELIESRELLQQLSTSNSFNRKPRLYAKISSAEKRIEIIRYLLPNQVFVNIQPVVSCGKDGRITEEHSQGEQ